MILNEKQLSTRLMAVANQLIPNKKLADIGTDHAYLPCYAYEKGIIPAAVCSEINEGPFQSAKGLITREGLSSIIQVRRGDGLSVLKDHEVEQITIAGMGGGLITQILEEGKTKLSGVERLILQPNVASHIVRKWLFLNKWTLIDETILEEYGIIYEILVAERGEQDLDVDVEKAVLFGPHLLKERTVIFHKKWLAELEKKKHILAQLNKASPSEEVHKKIETVKREIQLIKEALS